MVGPFLLLVSRRSQLLFSRPVSRAWQIFTTVAWCMVNVIILTEAPCVALKRSTMKGLRRVTAAW